MLRAEKPFHIRQQRQLLPVQFERHRRIRTLSRPESGVVAATSAFDAVAEGEQGEREQNWAENTSRNRGPSPRGSQRLICTAEHERFYSYVQCSLGTFSRPALADWRKRGRNAAKRGVDPGGPVTMPCR